MCISNSSMIPHQRDRQWIRGVRLDVASSVPSTMPLPLHSLQCFLVNLPNIQESDLTPKQQTNLSFYKTSIEKALAIYEDRTHIAVVEIDRRPSAKFGLQFCIDRTPSMRCKGPDITLQLENSNVPHVELLCEGRSVSNSCIGSV